MSASPEGGVPGGDLAEGAAVTCCLAAVDVQDLAGDVGRGLQEQDAVHDVADLACAAEPGKLVAKAVVAAGRAGRGLDDARGDGVDSDAARGVLDGQRAGGRGQTALGQRGLDPVTSFFSRYRAIR